jgi:hypothetical protein
MQIYYPPSRSHLGENALLGLFDECALWESELYVIFAGLACTDDPVVKPDWSPEVLCFHPFPFFDDFGVNLLDELADLSKHLAAPVAQFCYSLCD